MKTLSCENLYEKNNTTMKNHRPNLSSKMIPYKGIKVVVSLSIPKQLLDDIETKFEGKNRSNKIVQALIKGVKIK